MLLTTKQAAEAIGVTQRTIIKWVERGWVQAPALISPRYGYRISVSALQFHLRRSVHKGGQSELNLAEWLKGDGLAVVELQMRLREHEAVS